MRFFFYSWLGTFLLLGGLGQAQAQKSKQPEKKPPEPPPIEEIGGKKLPQWIKEISSRDRSKGENAIRTVVLFGPDRAYEAVPALLSELERHSVSYPIDVSIRVNATISLGSILGGVKDREPKHVERAVKIFSRLLSDGQAVVRYRAAVALGQIGPEARSSLAALLKALQDPIAWETRQAAAMALGVVAQDPKGKNPPPPEVITGLSRALTDPASAVRLAAIQSVISLGGPGNPIQRKLLAKYLDPVTSKDPEPTVRIWGQMAAMALNNEISEVRLGAIAKMLQHPDLGTRVQAAQALGRVGSPAKSTVPSLITALDDKDVDVILWSLWALARMEKDAAPALSAIRAVMDHPECPEHLKKAAASALESIQGKKKSKSSSSKSSGN